MDNNQRQHVRTKAPSSRVAWAMALLGLFATAPTTASPRPAISTEPHEIIWAVNNAPPFHIFKGEYQHQGICDTLVDAFEEALPQYRHRKELMPHPRISALMMADRNYCFPCVIHKADSDYAFHSEPTHTYPPHGIITRAELAQEWQQAFAAAGSDRVRLADILAQRQFRLGQPIARRYGDLQPLIEDYQLQTELHVNVSGDDNNVALMSMIESGRLDFTIDYQAMLRYYQLNGDRADSNLVFIPLQETAQTQIIGSVACSATDWGRESIAILNQAIPAIRTNQNFLNSLGLWLGGDDPQAYLDELEQTLGGNTADHND